MSMIQHLVSPKLPTALVDDTHVDLPGYDIFFTYVYMVYVIPTELDVSKFEDALSRVLQQYPHAAGQFRCTDGCWSIELTNTPVPVNIEYRRETSSGSLLNDTWVIQKDLSPLVNQHPRGVNIVNAAAPLLRLKLTFLDHETCIGLSWNHSLGDGFTVVHFLHMLSQFYQDLPPKFAMPTFKKYRFPVPSQSMLAELSSYMPLFPVPHFDLVAYVESCKDLEQVTWRISDQDLEYLRSTLSDVQNKKYLSKQDCLTAYCVAVLNENSSTPVQRVRNSSSYRHVSASFIPENSASNLLLLIPANVPTDMAGIAAVIRDEVIRSREPSCIYLYSSWQSEHMLEAANAGKFLPYKLSLDNELFVNSNIAFDWWSAHFGFPNVTRFHITGCVMHYLRCFGSNPTRKEDGEWESRDSIEISIGVSAWMKPKVLETLARGVRYMVDKQYPQV